MVVRSGVLTAWPRPQLPVVQPTEDATPAPPAVVDQALSPPLEEAIPPFDLATLLPDGGPADSDGSADSPSSALQALADVALDEIQPSTDLNGLDLSLTGGMEVEGSAPIIPPVPLPPSPRPGTPEAAMPASAVVADLRLPPPLHESPPAAVSVVHLPGVLTVVGDADGNSAYGGDPSPVGAPAPDQPIFFGDDFDMPAWIDGVAAEPLSPVPIGPDSVFEQPTAPPPPQTALPAAAQPTLTDKDLVLIARSTFGLAQLQVLVPAILAGCATPLMHDEVVERLQLLWLMRREVANQIRGTILLGLTHHELAGMVLSELLELAEQYAEDPQ